jgi:putative transcriptional regulator
MRILGEPFRQNLRRHRIANGLKQIDLAVKLGVEPPTVSRWEKGVALPSEDKIVALAKLFKISTQDLAGKKMPSDPASVLPKAPYTMSEFWHRMEQASPLRRALVYTVAFGDDSFLVDLLSDPELAEYARPVLQNFGPFLKIVK